MLSRLSPVGSRNRCIIPAYNFFSVFDTFQRSARLSGHRARSRRRTVESATHVSRLIVFRFCHDLPKWKKQKLTPVGKSRSSVTKTAVAALQIPDVSIASASNVFFLSMRFYNR